MTLGNWLREAKQRLELAGIESPSLEAQLLAGHVLRVDRTWIVSHPEIEIPDLPAEQVLQRRVAREPLAYILGWREFYGRRFEVGPGVLIPRQETEALVEACLGFPAKRVLDFGTGSGCIAITLKLEKPDWMVTASDISERALEIAARNAEDLGADVEFVASNGFAALGGRQFDLIVSNPPYIGIEEELMPEVGLHEPHEALFSGPTGLEFYQLLGVEAPDWLTSGGHLAVEVGHKQAEGVKELLESLGWQDVFTVEDLSGIGRVVVASAPLTRSLS